MLVSVADGEAHARDVRFLYRNYKNGARRQVRPAAVPQPG